MKQKLKVLIIVCLLFLACKNNDKIVVTGVYKGDFPCGNCIGIANTMTLNSDGTFVLENIYKGKGDEKVFKESGNYKIENGQVILSKKERPFKYAIGENYIELLDIDGKKIKSDLNYKLIKQE